MMATTLLHLNPFLPYLCFTSSTLLCCLFLQEFHNHHSLTFLSLFISFFLPTSLHCSLFCCIVISSSLPKVLGLLEFATLGQAKRVQEQHFLRYVRSWATTHMKFDNSQDRVSLFNSSFLPLVFVFLFFLVYLFV